MAMMEARQIFWQCERKVPIQVYPQSTVGSIKVDIAAQLSKDYDIEEEDVDPELYFQGQYLNDDSVELGQLSIVPNSVIIVLSEAVAKLRCEEGKIRSVHEAFRELFEAGEYSPGAEKEALKNAKPFPICGSTMDLGELGAGWPILFNFTGFLALLLIAIYFVYLPATTLYYSSDKIDQWPLSTDEHTVGSGLGSSGNLGPDGSESDLPAFCALAVAVLVVVAVLIMEFRISAVKKTVDKNEVDPNDFAIFVQGLPSVTKEEEIKEFFEENAREDEFTPVANVVIGFDVKKFNSAFEDFKKTTVERKSCTDPRQKAILDEQYNQFNTLYANPTALKSNLECTGCAIVIFQYQKHQRECLEQWRSCLHNCAWGLGMDWSSNPDFRDEYCLCVDRADNPDDILWENLGVPFGERVKAGLKTNAVMALFILLGFFVILGAQALRQYFAQQSLPYILSFLIVPIIAGTNAFEVFLARRYLEQEIHQTKTQQDVGLMSKLTVLYTVNYSLVLFFLNLPPERNWFCSKGLVMDIFVLELANAISYPIMMSCNLTGCVKSLFRLRYSSPESLAGKTQASLNKLYEAPQMKTPRAYAQLLKAWFLGLLYLPLIPLGTLFCGFGLVGYYWALKKHLLRDCKRPYRQSVVLGQRAIQFVEWGVIFFGVSQWFFVSYSMTGEGELALDFVMLIIMALGAASLISPPGLVGKLFSLCCDQSTYSDVDYYTAQYAWPKFQKYQTTNAVYLFMENAYILLKRKHRDFVMPWDPRNGNIPRPDVQEGDETPTSSTTTTPVPGKLTDAEEEDAGPLGEGSESIDTGEDPDACTGPIAAADPAKLALEEMKYKVPADLLGIAKDDKDADDDVMSTDGEEDADPEAPLIATLQQGMKARISGLTGMPAFNDTSCTIISADPGAKKYLVKLENDKQARLPFQNLEYEAGPFAPGARVKVVNIKKAPQYNNTLAIVLGWDKKNDKYIVKLKTGMKVRLLASNLEDPDLDG